MQPLNLRIFGRGKTEMLSVNQLKIVVTGASRGLGLATANGLNALGAEVIGVGRSQRPLELHD